MPIQDRAGVTELNLPTRARRKVKPAFDDVNSAQQDKDRALKNRPRLRQQDRAEARLPGARAHREQQRATDRGGRPRHRRCARFDLLVRNTSTPDVTRQRLWLETVQDVLAKNRVVVGGDGAS